jgi:hypothetical protein
MISSVLLNMFNQGASGVGYQGKGENIVQISSTAFVDDDNTHHSAGQTPGELVNDMLQDNN